MPVRLAALSAKNGYINHFNLVHRWLSGCQSVSLLDGKAQAVRL